MRLTILVLSSLVGGVSWAATPFTATVVNSTIKARPDGSRDVKTTVGKYFRDAFGRTREEHANSVTIVDPLARMQIILDTSAKTASITTLGGTAPASATPPKPGPITAASAPKSPYKPPTRLGSQAIQGLTANGYQAEIIVGPGSRGGTIVPKRVVSQMWQSEALGVPILIRTTESFITPSGDRFSSEKAMEYKDVVVNAAVSTDLFAVPGDYQLKNSR